jgi:hypothetical protein
MAKAMSRRQVDHAKRIKSGANLCEAHCAQATNPQTHPYASQGQTYPIYFGPT